MQEHGGSGAKFAVGAGVVALVLAAGLAYYVLQTILPGDNRQAANAPSPAPATSTTGVAALSPALPAPQAAAPATDTTATDPVAAVRQLGAHVHGEGHFDIAFENGVLSMNLVAPGDDIVGFEHPASTPEQQASLDKGLAALKAPLDLFRPDAGASCRASVTNVDWVTGLSEPQQEATAGAPATTTGEHAEFRSHYEFTCANPSALAKLGFHYFDVFPNAQSLAIQFISAKGQSAGEVDRSSPAFSLAGLI